MDQDAYKILDNVIYTSDSTYKPDEKGVGHYYYHQMLRNKDKLAQIDGYTKAEDTYGSLLQRSIRTALTMIDNGIQPGDHISICTNNHLNSAVPFIASYFTGSIMGAIEPTMSVQEATYLLHQTLPKMIFAAPSSVELVENVVEKIGTKVMIVVFGETSRHTPFSQFILSHQNENEFVPKEVESLNELALIVFSSGTSGMPKGICHSHLSMLFLSENSNVNHKLVLYSVVNPYWSLYPIFLHFSVEHSSARVIYPTFYNEEPWMLFYQPIHVGFLNTLQTIHLVRSHKPDKVNLKNVKCLSFGGNPLTLQQLNEIKSILPHTKILFGYSQSELFRGCFTSIKPELQARNELSVGTISKGYSYKVVDVETGKVLGPNQVGELQIKSSAQFIGYFNKDSSERFDSDGWLKTGDLFYYNEDLCFYIVDRIKESFKYHSYHITPVEIENVILDLEPIESAIVIGMPHEADISHAMAVIKLKANARKISGEEIVKHVEVNLEKHKWLRGGVTFVDSFPMNVNGKINRFQLRKLFLNKETT